MQDPSSFNVPNLLMPLLPDHWLAEYPESQLQIRTTEANTKSARRRSRRTQRRKALNHNQRNSS
jgi:hypothetical protein